MSNNPTNPNELIRLLLQQQQQQQQQTAPLLGNLMAAATSSSTSPGNDNPMPPPMLPSSADIQAQQQILALLTHLSTTYPNFAPAALTMGMGQQQAPSSLIQALQQQLQSQNAIQFHPPNQQGGQPNARVQHPPQHTHSIWQQSQFQLPSANQEVKPAAAHQTQLSTNQNQIQPQKPKPNTVVSVNTAGIIPSSISTAVKPVQQNKDPVVPSPAVPVPSLNLVALQRMSLQEVENYVRQLEGCNQPVPNNVRILMNDMKKREERYQAKLLSNRKSASSSRARKRQLIEELSAANAKLRYQALILSYMPDAVMALGTDSKINFASEQLLRILQYTSDELVGSNIEDILAPESQGEFRRLAKDLLTAEMIAAGEGGDRESSNEDNTSSSEDANVSRSADMEEASNNSKTPTASALKRKPLKVTDTDLNPQTTDSNKAKGTVKFDNVMGAPVTANNAGAMLSSLQYPKEEILEGDEKKLGDACLNSKHELPMLDGSNQDSPFSSDNDPDDSPVQGASDSSDGYADESSISGTSSAKNKGYNRRSPLAPSCTVKLVRKDISTVVCELTTSIRTRSADDDNDLINTHNNSKHTKKVPEKQQVEEKELLLCLRPLRFLGGDRVVEFNEMAPQISESSNNNESDGSTQNKVSSCSDKEGSSVSDFGKDVASSDGPSKKRKLENLDSEATSSSNDTSQKKVRVKEKPCTTRRHLKLHG